MNNQDLLQNPKYDPNRLMDFLIEGLALKNDAQLSRKLEISPVVISKIRHLRIPVGDAILVRISDLTDMPTREIKQLMFRGEAQTTEAQRAQSWSAMLASAATSTEQVQP